MLNILNGKKIRVGMYNFFSVYYKTYVIRDLYLDLNQNILMLSWFAKKRKYVDKYQRNMCIVLDLFYLPYSVNVFQYNVCPTFQCCIEPRSSSKNCSFSYQKFNLLCSQIARLTLTLPLICRRRRNVTHYPKRGIKQDSSRVT